jgi:outer membrane lipoprotein-sorting protein
MKSYNFLLFFFILFINADAQQSAMTSKKDNDPKAKNILDKLKKQFDGYKTMEVSFEMELELPNQPMEKQSGSLIQDQNKYVVKMKDQEIYADGKTVWIYLKKNKEVQISDYDDAAASEFMSPKQMMMLYEKGDYVYSIIEERRVGSQTFTDIEFKPLSKKSDIAKLRLTVDAKANKMISLRVFSKDGSRYILKVNSIIPNKKHDASLFSLNTKTLKGVHIEDLRMD